MPSSLGGPTRSDRDKRSVLIGFNLLPHLQNLTPHLQEPDAWKLSRDGEITGFRWLVYKLEEIVGKEIGTVETRTQVELILAAGLGKLATLLKYEGDFAEARSLYERVLAIKEKALGPEHPDTAASLIDLADVLIDLADVLRDQGDFVGARPLCERALGICERALGPDHLKTADTLLALSRVLFAQGDFAACWPPVERALAIHEKALGPDIETLSVSSDLALVLRGEGELAGARSLYEQALAISEKALGPEHPDTVMRLNSLADVLYDQGDLAGARPLYERALAISEKTLGPDHPSTALSLVRLASLLKDQGDLVGARPLYERAQAIVKRTKQQLRRMRLGPALSRLLLLIGRPAGALTLGENALAVHDKALGRDHSRTKDTARVTADALDALGRTEEAKALRERYGVTSSDDPMPS